MTAYTNRGMKWEMASSWWVLLTLVPFGLVSFIAFFYAGGLTGNRRWKVYGFSYMVAIIVAIATTATGIGLVLALATWGLSIIHAFKIRPAFLVQLDLRLTNKKTLDYQKVSQLRKEAESLLKVEEPMSSNMLEARVKDSKVSNSYNNDLDSDKVRNELSDTLDTLSRRTSLSEEMQPAPVFEKGLQIDINRASEIELASIPEIGIILAKKIVFKREEVGGFDSFSQFSQLMNLREQAALRLESKFIFATVDKPKINEELKQGRIIDF